LTMTVKANWIDLYSHYNTHTMQYILGVSWFYCERVKQATPPKFVLDF
jgi:hypothetical protein